MKTRSKKNCINRDCLFIFAVSSHLAIRKLKYSVLSCSLQLLNPILSKPLLLLCLNASRRWRIIRSKVVGYHFKLSLFNIDIIFRTFVFSFPFPSVSVNKNTKMYVLRTKSTTIQNIKEKVFSVINI